MVHHSTMTQALAKETVNNYGISISVVPQFVAEQSKPDENLFVHSYSVTIKNNSDKDIQLVNRHWRVYSAGVQIADVKGEGVIGQQPLIRPEEEFAYSSWTLVRDAFGTMKGAYTFYREDGKFFDVDIPEFQLIYIDQSQVH